MIAYTCTTDPPICEMLLLLILSKIGFSITSTQTKEQAPKPGLCCLTYPYDCHALAAAGV